MKMFATCIATMLLATAVHASPAAAPTATAATPPASVTSRPAWLPEVKPGKGLVVIFREKRFYGSANAMKVFADEGVALPKVKNGSFVYYYFEPGDHRLYADKKKQRDARILGVEAGQVYFFEARFEAKAWHGADIDLVPLDYAEGVRRIGALGQAASG